LKFKVTSRIVISFASIHFFIAIIAFLIVQFSDDGQAGFLWFLFFYLDFPVGQLAYDSIGKLNVISNLIDWWYTIPNHQGPNIRALIIFGVIGTLYWYLIGLLLSFVISKIKANKAIKPRTKSGTV
jgi:hypothetical protein